MTLWEPGTPDVNPTPAADRVPLWAASKGTGNETGSGRGAQARVRFRSKTRKWAVKRTAVPTSEDCGPRLPINARTRAKQLSSAGQGACGEAATGDTLIARILRLNRCPVHSEVNLTMWHRCKPAALLIWRSSVSFLKNTSFTRTTVLRTDLMTSAGAGRRRTEDRGNRSINRGNRRNRSGLDLDLKFSFSRYPLWPDVFVHISPWFSHSSHSVRKERGFWKVFFFFFLFLQQERFLSNVYFKVFKRCSHLQTRSLNPKSRKAFPKPTCTNFGVLQALQVEMLAPVTKRSTAHSLASVTITMRGRKWLFFFLLILESGETEGQDNTQHVGE